MGYATRAEYTIDILRDPAAYDHITQRFLCTGFVLATTLNERVLTAVLQRWREIDLVTSNRIRFLFFIENETVLRGYPSRPWFTTSGYERYHQRFLTTARARGFKVSVQPHAQVHLDGARQWHPQQPVTRLAQQLGISGSVPCLVWARHDKPDSIFLRPLTEVDPDALIKVVRDFCNQLYDCNAEVLSTIDSLESEIENRCNLLSLTRSQVDTLQERLPCRESLLAFQRSLRDLSIDPYHGVSPKDVALLARQMLDLGLPFPPETTDFLHDALAWDRRSSAVLAFLKGAARLPVPYAAATFVDCSQISARLPAGAPSLSSPTTIALSDYSARFAEVVDAEILSRLQTEVPDLAARASRSRDYILRAESKTPSFDEQAAVTVINLLVLLRGIIAVLPGPTTKRLLDDLQADLISVFTARLRDAGTTIVLWMYFYCSDRLRALDTEMSDVYGTADDQSREARRWLKESKEILDRIGSHVETIDWGALREYREVSIPSGALAGVYTKYGSHEEPTKDLASLHETLEARLRPIRPVMAELSADRASQESAALSVSARLERLQERIAAGGGISLAPGATLALGNAEVHIQDTSLIDAHGTSGDVMHKTTNITVGDHAVVTNLAVAERIVDSFNRVGESSLANELREALKKLHQAVAEMTIQMSEEAAKRAADDLEVLTREATSTEPRRRWYELSGEGLVEAAKAVGELGEKVIPLVKSVLSLLA